MIVVAFFKISFIGRRIVSDDDDDAEDDDNKEING